MSGPASNTTKSAVDQRYLQYEPAIDATSKGCVMLPIVVFDLAWQRRSRCDYLESQPWSGPFVGGMGRFIAFDRPRPATGGRRISSAALRKKARLRATWAPAGKGSGQKPRFP
jgi:hypothetical protein